MKTDVEQTMPLDAAAVWAEETSKPVKPKQPGARLASTLGVLMLVLAVGATIQTYLSGLEQLRMEAAHFADNAPANHAREATQLLKQADNLALKMAAAPIAGGAGPPLGIFAGGGSLRRRRRNDLAATEPDLEQQAQKIHSQLVDAKITEAG